MKLPGSALLLGVAFACALCPAAVHVDTVGTTAVDYQNYGPTWQRVFNLPGSGIHVCWLKTGMSENFYGYSVRAWRGEVGVFGSLRNSAGNLDVFPRPGSAFYGSAFVSSFLSRDPKWPVVAVESMPGSGIFAVRPQDTSLMGCEKAPVAFTGDGWLHLLCLDSVTQDTLLYSRSTDWGRSWSDLQNVCAGAAPRDPTHSICASDSTQRVAAVWSTANDQALWVNISNDGGATWAGPQDLFPVPSGLSGARPGKLGGFGFFDRDDRLNVVTQVWDGTNQHPSEIWSWQEGRSPAWAMVYHFAPGSVIAPAEAGEPFSLRPSIGQRRGDGRLFVAWMNYDAVNYEPQTNIARPDLYLAQSTDNGVYWSRPLRVTGPDNGARLSPCLAPIVTDTVVLSAVVDSVAGIFELGHGPQTTNRCLVIRVPVTDVPAVAEGVRPVARPVLSVRPGLVRDLAIVSAPAGPVIVRDAQGRLVCTLRSGGTPFRWDARGLQAGIYFLSSPAAPAAARVTKTR